MSYNLVDPTTGDLTRVAGGIDTSIIPSNASASNKLVTEETVNTELNKKANSTEVAHIKRFNSVPGNDWNNAIEEGYYTIPIDSVADTIENRPFNYAIQMRVIKSDTNEPNYVYQIAYVSSQDSRIYIRKQNGEGIWSAWGEIITSNNIGSQTVASANKIEPNYTSVALTTVTSNTIKYIKLADCNWYETGTLQVRLNGNKFVDTLVINFGGGNATVPMLCGHYNGNSNGVYSVIVQKGSDWNSVYSIYVKVRQLSNLTVNVALLKGDCTINITESTTAPTNISEWKVGYGFFGNITSPNLASLEERVTALESKL